MSRYYYPHSDSGVRLPAVVTLHGGVPISQGSHVPLVRGSWFLPSPIHIIGQWLQWMWLLTWRKICGIPHEISTQMRKQTNNTHEQMVLIIIWMQSFSDTYPRASPTPHIKLCRTIIRAIWGTIMGLCGTITVIVGGCDVVPWHMSSGGNLYKKKLPSDYD